LRGFDGAGKNGEMKTRNGDEIEFDGKTYANGSKNSRQDAGATKSATNGGVVKIGPVKAAW
jgi:hypothetical protein